MMDEIDRKLLTLLQEDASLSLAQLAERVGLSSTPCWKRVQKLEARGVLARRVALVAPEKVGVGLIVFVAIEAADHSPEWLDRFARTVAAMPEVMEVYRMAGEIDYMLRVAVADMAAFDIFYKSLIAAVPLRNVTSRSRWSESSTPRPIPCSAAPSGTVASRVNGPAIRKRKNKLLPRVAGEDRPFASPENFRKHNHLTVLSGCVSLRL
ncbi:Lrp/AsnC family transcriptional regulator [Pseudoroseomonas wenyumeiae]